MTASSVRCKLVALAAVLLPCMTLGAQRCMPAPLNLSTPSPRERLRALTLPAGHSRELAFDGVTCVADSSAGIYRRGDVVFGERVTSTVHPPLLRVVAQGGVADARSAGQMWTGRGLNVLVRPGISVTNRWANAVFAPAVWWSENRAFHFLAGSDSTRSAFASPWYRGDYSLDQPSRMGLDPLLFLDPGESALWTTVRGIDAGVATSSQAWGPGLRGHLILGPDAPGIGRVFVRTAQPLSTPVGPVHATAFLGALVESRFFDRDPSNDVRPIYAVTTEIRPGNSEMISVGASHGVMLSSAGLFSGESEQMSSLALQLRSPGDAARAWVEVGRMGGLPALGRFFRIPYQGIAYLAGFEYAAPMPWSSRLLLSAEAQNLEQPPDIRERPSRDFYTGRSVPQGWTHRGRVLGAAAGPGSQTQWLAVDWIARRWSAGLFGERVRWNEDALFREYLPYPNRHDVSARAGLRAGVVIAGYEAEVSASLGKRLNYLFQNATYLPGYRTVDVSIPQFRVTLSPMLP